MVWLFSEESDAPVRKSGLIQVEGMKKCRERQKIILIEGHVN
jgi:hypothetical protein